MSPFIYAGHGHKPSQLAFTFPSLILTSSQKERDIYRAPLS